jgi:hypothetical protein
VEAWPLQLDAMSTDIAATAANGVAAISRRMN